MLRKTLTIFSLIGLLLSVGLWVIMSLSPKEPEVNRQLHEQLEILWADDRDVERALAAHEKILKIATKDDLPELLSALASDRNDFWTRELLAEPVIYLSGVEHLEELFDALKKNDDDGHDSDGLYFSLSEHAEMHPERCRKRLDGILKDERSPHHEHARWLMEFCKKTPCPSCSYGLRASEYRCPECGTER